MADRREAVLDEKPLQSLRVVDLRTALGKRGLPNSGTKKVLVERLKLQLKLEKIQQESVAVEGRVPNLGLQDELPAQNDFVRQYLLEQQKTYALQLEARKLAEKSTGVSAEEPIQISVSQPFIQNTTQHCVPPPPKPKSKDIRQPKRERWKRHSVTIHPGLSRARSSAKEEPFAHAFSGIETRKTRLSSRLSTVKSSKLCLKLLTPSSNAIEYNVEETETIHSAPVNPGMGQDAAIGQSAQHCSLPSPHKVGTVSRVVNQQCAAHHNLLPKEVENLGSNQEARMRPDEEEPPPYASKTKRRRRSHACQSASRRSLPVCRDKRTLRARVQTHSSNNQLSEGPKEAHNLSPEDAYQQYISIDEKLQSSIPIVVITPILAEYLPSTHSIMNDEDSLHSGNEERPEEVNEKILPHSIPSIFIDGGTSIEDAHDQSCATNTAEGKEVPFVQQALKACPYPPSTAYTVPNTQKPSSTLMSIPLTSQILDLEGSRGEPNKASEYNTMQPTEEKQCVARAGCKGRSQNKISDSEGFDADSCLPSKTPEIPLTSSSISSSNEALDQNGPHESVEQSMSLGAATPTCDSSESCHHSQSVTLKPCVRQPLTIEETSSAVQSILESPYNESVTVFPDGHCPPEPSTHLYDDHEIASATHSLIQEMCPREEESLNSSHGKLSMGAASVPLGDPAQVSAVSVDNPQLKTIAAEEQNDTDNSLLLQVPGTEFLPTYPTGNLNTPISIEYIHDSTPDVQNVELNCSSEAVKQLSEMDVYSDSALTSLQQEVLIPPGGDHTMMGEQEERMELQGSERPEEEHQNAEQQQSHLDQWKGGISTSPQSDLAIQDISHTAPTVEPGSGEKDGRTLNEGLEFKTQGATHCEDAVLKGEKAFEPGSTTAYSEDTNKNLNKINVSASNCEDAQHHSTDEASKGSALEAFASMPLKGGRSSNSAAFVLHESADKVIELSKVPNMKVGCEIVHPGKGNSDKYASPPASSDVLQSWYPISTHDHETLTPVDMVSSQEMLHDLQTASPALLVDTPSSSMHTGTTADFSTSQKCWEVERENTDTPVTSQTSCEHILHSPGEGPYTKDHSVIEGKCDHYAGQKHLLLKCSDKVTKAFDLPSLVPRSFDCHRLPSGTVDTSDTQRHCMDMSPSDHHADIPLQWHVKPQGEVEQIKADPHVLHQDTESSKASFKALCGYALQADDARQPLTTHIQEEQQDSKSTRTEISPPTSPTGRPSSVGCVSSPVQDGTSERPFQMHIFSQQAVSPHPEGICKEELPSSKHAVELKCLAHNMDVEINVQSPMTGPSEGNGGAIAYGTPPEHCCSVMKASRSQQVGSTRETKTNYEYLLHSDHSRAEEYIAECCDQPQANVAQTSPNEKTRTGSIETMQPCGGGMIAKETCTISGETTHMPHAPVNGKLLKEPTATNEYAEADLQGKCGESTQVPSVDFVKGKVILKDATTGRMANEAETMLLPESCSQDPPNETESDDTTSPKISATETTVTVECCSHRCSSEICISKHGTLELQDTVEEPRLTVHVRQATEVTEIKPSSHQDIPITHCTPQTILDQNKLCYTSGSDCKCHRRSNVGETSCPATPAACTASITYSDQGRELCTNQHTIPYIRDPDETSTSGNDNSMPSATAHPSENLESTCFLEGALPDTKNWSNRKERHADAKLQNTTIAHTGKGMSYDTAESVLVKSTHEPEDRLQDQIVKCLRAATCELQQSNMEGTKILDNSEDQSTRTIESTMTESLLSVRTAQFSVSSDTGHQCSSYPGAALHVAQDMLNAASDIPCRNMQMLTTVLMPTQECTMIADKKQSVFESGCMTRAVKVDAGPPCQDAEGRTTCRGHKEQCLRPGDPCAELSPVMDVQDILESPPHSCGLLTPPNDDEPQIERLMGGMDESPAHSQELESGIHTSPGQLQCGRSTVEACAEDQIFCVSQGLPGSYSKEDAMARLRGRGTRRQTAKDAKATKESPGNEVSDEDSESDSKRSKRLRNGRRAFEESDKARKLRRSPRHGSRTPVDNTKSSSSSSSESESGDETVPDSAGPPKKEVLPRKPREEDCQHGSKSSCPAQEGSPESGANSESSPRHSTGHQPSRFQKGKHSLPSESPTRECSVDHAQQENAEEGEILTSECTGLPPVKEELDTDTTRGGHCEAASETFQDSKFEALQEAATDAPDRNTKEDALRASSPPKFKARRLSTAALKKESDSKEIEDKQQIPRKRRWGSTNVVVGPSLSISTNALKNLIPDLDEAASVKMKVEPVEESVICEASPGSEKSQLDVTTPVDEKPATLPEKKSTVQEKTTPAPKRSVVPPRAVSAPSREEKQPSPAKNPKSRTLFVRNLVRPFTLNQLKQLLKEFGDTDDSEFWIDKIKSKCFVTYMSEEDAVKAREALHQLRWPLCNPKILHVDFSTPEEIARQKEPPAPPAPPAPHPTRAVVSLDRVPVTYPLRTVEVDCNSIHTSRPSRQEAAAHAHRTRPEATRHVEPQEPRGSPLPVRARAQQPVREWDRDKLVQESPERASPPRRERHSAERKERREKKVAKRKQEEDTPAKLLDDLFRKTKASPCIYWLPLTEAQIRQREEERRQRQLERERRRQQQQQEEEERRRKGMGREPSSRQRDRDSRRSISRSPVRRR